MGCSLVRSRYRSRQHDRARGYPVELLSYWIPAYAGMTRLVMRREKVPLSTPAFPLNSDSRATARGRRRGGISCGGSDSCLLRVSALNCTVLWERRKPRRVAKRPLLRRVHKSVALVRAFATRVAPTGEGWRPLPSTIT
jgi:hypothetical protein